MALRALFIALFAIVATTLARAQESTPKAGEAPQAKAAHVKVDGELDIGMKSLLRRAIDRAKADQSVLVIELDTPGGEIQLMFDLSQQISAAAKDGVITVAWVHDHALSAGALLAIACKKIYMTSTATIGSSTPVTIGPSGIMSIPDEAVREKISSEMRATFRAFAANHGRPPALAEAMIDRHVGVRLVRDEDGSERLITDVEWDDARMKGNPPALVRTIAASGELIALTGPEAVALQLADGVAETLDEVLAKVGARGALVQSIPRAQSEDLASFLDSIRLLLLVGGLLALYMEFKAPGFSGAGVVAIVCFALLLFGRYLVGLADVPQIVAVAVGLVLIAVELFVLPGQLWAGLLGGALVIGGLAFAQFGPGILEYPLARSSALDDALKLAASILAAVLMGYGLSRVLPKTPMVGRLVLEPTPVPIDTTTPRIAAGELGSAVTDLRPVGKVRLDSVSSSEYEARSSGIAIDRGARVRVVAIEGGRLVVEPDSNALEQDGSRRIG